MEYRKRDKFEVIHSLKREYPVGLLCSVAGVSRAGYYRWLRYRDSERDTELKELVRDEYARVRGIYGYRRMQIVLRRKHHLTVNHKRVCRLMKELQLQSIIRRKKYNKFSYERHTVTDNILNSSAR